MKFVILSGSPKGETSVTQQYLEFIRREFPQHEFREFLISPHIRKYENDRSAFDEVIAAVAAAAAVLWATPVYVYLVPSQYKRFIELIGERGATAAFRGKYAASLTTSIHFFDHTANEYLRAVSEDLEMKFVGSHSPEMYDLMHREGRRLTRLFAEHLFAAVGEQWPLPRRNAPPAAPPPLHYAPGAAGPPVAATGKKILVLHDAPDADGNLARMVDRLQQAFGGAAQAVNLRDVDLKGGCLGCLRCGWDNACAYDGQDGNRELHATYVAPAELVVFAGAIVDRYLSSRWKMFFDRAFFHNHIPWLAGKHLAWVISGPLAANANLRHILESIPAMQRADLVDIVTDETSDSAELDRRLDYLAARLVRQADENFMSPHMGPAVGGDKIFRDNIYGRLRVVFHADHLYYKRHGRYNFPQKRYRERLSILSLAPLFWLPSFRERFYKKEIKNGMIRPLQKVLASTR